MVFLLLISPSAFAYIDPGSGSYIFQLILGVLLGVCFSLKLSWLKIKSFLLNFFSSWKDKKNKRRKHLF